MKQDNLGNLLIELRKTHGYTQDDISDMMHVTRQAVSKWENGIALPDVFTIIKLGKLYKKPLLASFYGEEFASEFNQLLKLRLFRRILSIWLIISFVLLLTFGTFFIYSNNSTYRFLLDYEDDVLTIKDSYIIASNNEAIIQIGDITLNGESIYNMNDYSITMYYTKNNQEKIIAEFSKSREIRLSNSENYKKIMTEVLNKKINLYLKITYLEQQRYNHYIIVLTPTIQNNYNFLVKDNIAEDENSGLTLAYINGYNKFQYRDYLTDSGFNAYDEMTLYRDEPIIYGLITRLFVSNHQCILRYSYNNYDIIYSNDNFYVFDTNQGINRVGRVRYHSNEYQCVDNCRYLSDTIETLNKLRDYYLENKDSLGSCNY